MTIIHDPTEEDYVWHDGIKRPGASLDNAKPAISSNNESMWRMRKLNVAHNYNQNMGGSDSHAQQNNYYSTSRHWHCRNWLPLFFLLIDAAVTNSYILYKLAYIGEIQNRLSHAAFQEEIARHLLNNPGAVLRRRLPTQTNQSLDFSSKIVCKEATYGHSWGAIPSQRQCYVCCPPKRPGKPRKALQEISSNMERVQLSTHRTTHCCTHCKVPICYNSRCWERHLERRWL